MKILIKTQNYDKKILMLNILLFTL